MFSELNADGRIEGQKKNHKGSSLYSQLIGESSKTLSDLETSRFLNRAL
jgi:hypothetical protein